MSCEDIPSLLDLQNTKKHVDDLGRLMGTGEGDSTNEVTGQVRPTYNKVMKSVGFKPGSGDFTTGFTVMPGERDISWYDPVSLNWYSYLGVIPTGGYPVAPETNPVGIANWKPVTDELLRSDLSSDGGDGHIGRFKSVNQMKASSKPVLGMRYSVLGYSAARDGGAGDWLAVDSATNPANGVSVVQSTIIPTLCFVFMAAIGGVVNIAQVGAAPAGDITNILNNLHADTNVMKVQVSPPAATPYYTVSSAVAVKKDMEFINQPTLTFTSTTATLAIEAPAKLEGFKVYCNNTTSWSHKVIQVKSSDVTLNKFSVDNAVEVPYGQFATGVHIGSTSKLTNINISDCMFSRMRTTIDATDVENLNVSKLRAFKYVTSVYLKDVKHSRFKDAYMYGRSDVLTGRAGENGVLVEATVDNGCIDIEIESFFVQESGEHGFRLGGQKTITDFKFKSCTSLLTGQAWKVGNTAAGEWHGGCGFKILGGTDVLGHQHRRISLTDCTAIDCSDNYGSYPAGHGVNNFSSFLIMMVDGVTMNGCKSMKLTNVTASGSHGLLIGSASNVTVSGGKLKDSYLACVRLFDESAEFGGVSSQVGISDIQIDTNASMTRSAPIIRLSSNVNPVSDVTLNVVSAGGNGLAYSEPVGAASYLRVFLNGFYTGSESGSEPVVWGSPVAIINITAPWRGYSPSAVNGSSLLDYTTGDYRYKKAGSWVTR